MAGRRCVLVTRGVKHAKADDTTDALLPGRGSRRAAPKLLVGAAGFEPTPPSPLALCVSSGLLFHFNMLDAILTSRVHSQCASFNRPIRIGSSLRAVGIVPACLAGSFRWWLRRRRGVQSSRIACGFSKVEKPKSHLCGPEKITPRMPARACCRSSRSKSVAWRTVCSLTCRV